MAHMGSSPDSRTDTRMGVAVQGSGLWPFGSRFGVQVANLTPFDGEVIAMGELVMRLQPGQTVQGGVRVPHDGQHLPLAFRVFDEMGTAGFATANPRTYGASSSRRRAGHAA
jgi:hypothetical protein